MSLLMLFVLMLSLLFVYDDAVVDVAVIVAEVVCVAAGVGDVVVVCFAVVVVVCVCCWCCRCCCSCCRCYLC